VLFATLVVISSPFVDLEQQGGSGSKDIFCSSTIQHQ
jgi:hypothetical protein